MSEAGRHEDYQAYPATVLAFEGGPRVDLRWRLGTAERRALAEQELGPTFAVLTAENPEGVGPADLSPEEADALARESVRRTLRFEEHLVRSGVRYRRVEAVSPDAAHRERCVAVALPRDEAQALARARHQVALFWYDGERFWLWPARVDEAPPPLPP